LVLSLIYWTFALFMTWSVHAYGGGGGDDASGVILCLAVMAYVAVAAICWALSGFARR